MFLQRMINEPAAEYKTAPHGLFFELGKLELHTLGEEVDRVDENKVRDALSFVRQRQDCSDKETILKMGIDRIYTNDPHCLMQLMKKGKKQYGIY